MDFDTEQQTLFALDQPGPPMSKKAAKMVRAAIDLFIENPEMRTTVSFILEEGPRYNLLGACLYLDGADLLALSEYNDRWDVGVSILLEELKLSTFDFYAIEELNQVAESPAELLELFEDYVAFPSRVDGVFRHKQPHQW